MTPQNQMLANALKAKYNSLPISQKDIKEFLQSIPGAVNLKEDTEAHGVYSVQVIRTLSDIILVESNGIDFLITELT